jgi:hypothetical protein
VVIWTIPSERASANPRSAAFSVSEEVTLTAGYAKPPPRAASIISRYWSGVARAIARAYAGPRVGGVDGGLERFGGE